MMFLYSLLLGTALAVSAPWWLWRMATSGRYRAGLAGRLGFVPEGLRDAVAGRPVVWVHAVSVGEVLAATRLIAELQAALPGYVVAVSTTTKTGQELAKTRLAGVPVFYLPLDFAWAVRRYLDVLKPRLLVLMESELWPRMLVECDRRGVPVAVVNARVSDRSFPRYMRLRWLWKPLLAKVGVFLAQSEETAERLRRIGAPVERVRCLGNLKYDAPELASANQVVVRLRELIGESKLLVAGSTLPGEEAMVLEAWKSIATETLTASLLLAPRHPERFREVEKLLWETTERQWMVVSSEEFRDDDLWEIENGCVFLLDTIGDLAAVYAEADVAFIGGSMVPKGGHNPLEAARFGVPVVMGPSFENFREVVATMQIVDGIRIVEDEDQLLETLIELLVVEDLATALGERGRQVFEAQSGATGRTVEALLRLMQEREG